jgi:hypothetical protein
VHLGVRQIEAAAEHVAKVVVQRRARNAKADTRNADAAQ